MLNTFKKYMCDTCKSECCNKGITIIKSKDLYTLRCKDYVKDENKVERYIPYKYRTAKQHKSLMGFTQQY